MSDSQYNLNHLDRTCTSILKSTGDSKRRLIKASFPKRPLASEMPLTFLVAPNPSMVRYSTLLAPISGPLKDALANFQPILRVSCFFRWTNRHIVLNPKSAQQHIAPEPLGTVCYQFRAPSSDPVNVSVRPLTWKSANERARSDKG